jgi:hypothetical protein
MFFLTVRINDTVTFVEDGFDEDIEFGDEVSDEGEGDPVDNVSIMLLKIYIFIWFESLIILVYAYLDECLWRSD